MTELDLRILAVALAGTLALAGCGKRQAESQVASADNETAGAVDSQQPAFAAGSATGTNDGAASAANPNAEFLAKSAASAFAQAEPALKRSYNRALIAFQIGDYPRAVTELRDLAETPDLPPKQKQAVQELMAEALKQAPELGTGSDAGKADAVREFPVAMPDPNAAPGAPPKDPFSTADPAVLESFARAKAAYDIGDYASALAELQGLATNSQLNFQQKYAVQALLDKTPRTSPR